MSQEMIYLCQVEASKQVITYKVRIYCKEHNFFFAVLQVETLTSFYKKKNCSLNKLTKMPFSKLNSNGNENF